jgi:hypothetical protein
MPRHVTKTKSKLYGHTLYSLICFFYPYLKSTVRQAVLYQFRK